MCSSADVQGVAPIPSSLNSAVRDGVTYREFREQTELLNEGVIAYVSDAHHASLLHSVDENLNV